MILINSTKVFLPIQMLIRSSQNTGDYISPLNCGKLGTQTILVVLPQGNNSGFLMSPLSGWVPARKWPSSQPIMMCSTDLVPYPPCYTLYES